MTQTLPLDLPAVLNEIRGATVVAYGPGQRNQLLIVRIDGVRKPVPVLGPPKGLPAIGERIAVRSLANGWAHAGEARS